MTFFVFLANNDIRFRHFIVEIISFPGALPHACKHGDAAVQCCDIVDQLHNDDRFAYASAAKRPYFAAFEEGTDQVNDFDTGSEHLWRSGLIHQRWGRAMNRVKLIRLYGALLVHGFTRDIEHPPHDSLADGHRYRGAFIDNLQPALKPLCAGHRYGTHPVITEVLLDFKGQLRRLALYHIINGERIEDRRDLSSKLDIHNWTDDLNDFAFIHGFENLRKL